MHAQLSGKCKVELRFFLAIVIYELFSTQGDQNTMTLTLLALVAAAVMCTLFARKCVKEVYM